MAKGNRVKEKREGGQKARLVGCPPPVFVFKPRFPFFKGCVRQVLSVTVAVLASFTVLGAQRARPSTLVQGFGELRVAATVVAAVPVVAIPGGGAGAVACRAGPWCDGAGGTITAAPAIAAVAALAGAGRGSLGCDATVPGGSPYMRS